MLGIKKRQFKKIKNFFKKLPLALAENAFLVSLVLFFIAIILGGTVFYNYSILLERKKPESSEKPLYFDEKKFESVLKAWQDRQKKFEEADSKEYLNPFKITQ